MLKSRNIRLNIRSAWKALLILFAGLLATVIVTINSHISEKEKVGQEFNDVCDEIMTKIAVRMQDHALLLHTASAYIEAQDTVTRQNWKTFNQQAKIAKDLPGIQGLGYAVIVPANHLKQHIASIRGEGFPAFTVRPSGDRPIYTSVIYLEPFSGRNLRAFGYDMYSESVRRKAMEFACDSDKAALSGKVTLVQETDEDLQAGTLMFVPVFRMSQPIETVEQRRAAIKGWVYCPYRMNDLMHGILGRWDNYGQGRIRLQIFDEAISPGSLLYDSQVNEQTARETQPAQSVTLPVEFNGRKWVLLLTKEKTPLLAALQKELLLLLGGVVISLLLFFLSLSLLRTKLRALKIADNLTKELKQSEEQLRFAFEETAVGMCRVGLDGKFQWINSAFTSMLGYSSDELLGEPFSKITHPEDQDIGPSEMKRIISGKAKSSYFEKRYLDKTGGTVWASVVITLIGNSGNSPFFVTQITNITEKKKSEHELRKLSQAVQQSPVSIFITNTHGEIEYVNPQTERITGYTFEELRGKNPRILKSGETPDEEYKELWETIKSGKQWVGTFHNKNKDGMLYWESATIAPILDAEGKVINYLAVKEDITEKKKANDELVASEAKLKEANATKDKLFSIIAHDLRGPIGSFEPVLEMLTNEEGLTEEERSILMEGLLKASKTTFSLLENLLNWARSQSNGIELKPGLFNLADLVHRNVELLSSTATKKNIHLEVKLTDLLPVWADEDSINLVVRNLLSNAIKFTRSEGRVILSAVDKGQQVEVTVEDTGVGMSAEVMEKLFKPNSFYTSYGTNAEKGSGLGLLLCKDFVEKNGGEIRIESVLGEGSRFIFTLPKE